MDKKKRLTEEELLGLYPGLKLLEGYNTAFVGVISAPNDEFLPVYDTFKLIDIISAKEFSSKDQVHSYFDKIVKEARRDNGIGPLFMQSVAISTNDNDSINEILGDDLGSDSDSDSDSFVSESDHAYEWESDSDSDSDFDSEEALIVYESGSDSDSGSDYEEISGEEYEDDPDGYSYLQVTVHIGTNDPEDCKITSKVDNVKQALALLFPNLDRLELIKEMKFYFADPEDLEDEE